MASTHEIQWVTAQPLWDVRTGTPDALRQPVLLRFETDRFMEELSARLREEPERPIDLVPTVARWETFREPPTGEPAGWQADPEPLKLYQPAHGHFYLVAASLVCRLPGMPDHAMSVGLDEKAAFVLRRLASDGRELAWVDSTDSAGKSTRAWQPLETWQNTEVAAGEELLPMFPVLYTVGGRRRRLLAGFIPTSSRETFEAGPHLSPFQTEGDPRLTEVEQRVVEALRALKEQADPATITDSEAGAQLEAQQREASRYLLLDLADFLTKKLSEVWGALEKKSSAGLKPKSSQLYTTLTTYPISASAGAPYWREGLLTAMKERLFIGGEDDGASSLNWNMRTGGLTPDTLYSLLDGALKEYPASSTSVPSTPIPRLDPQGEAFYVLRCVYHRPKCGPLKPHIVSVPTESFRIAPFFDADAPGRPIRIVMPLDTSIAGLRKFKRNVSIVMSDALRKQMMRATDLENLMAGKAGSDGGITLGEICSFSIPIITICAMIVLMIFVILLNIIFWWLPLLRICLPIVLPAKKK